MANEVTATGSVAYSDANGVKDSLAISSFVSSVGTKIIQRSAQSIPTSETAVNLGPVSAPGYAVLVNRDPTNYVDVKVATSGAVFARLLPNGGFCVVYLGSGAQAPYAVANTAACVIDVFICSQ